MSKKSTKDSEEKTPTLSGNAAAVRSFIEWAEERGLELSSVQCGDCRVDIRSQDEFAGYERPVLRDSDDLVNRDVDGHPYEEPKNAHSAYAQRLWGHSHPGTRMLEED